MPKDWFLLVIILLVVAGDLLIILLGTVIPSSRFSAVYIPDQEHPQSVDVSHTQCMGGLKGAQYSLIIHEVLVAMEFYFSTD